jgi:predicted Rossmann fold flavoprotein
MTTHCHLAIVGAGAAGLAAAIFAGERAIELDAPLKIVLLDGARPIGRKILVAGGGRCNVTHDRVTADDYNGPRPVVRNVLAAFTAQDTVRWFAGLGVALKTEATGKLFPVTDDARTVLHALVGRAGALGVTLWDGHRVMAIARTDAADGESFEITHARGTLRAHCVILATGGRSLPRSGSDGGGYGLAGRLGHTVTDTFPALVPLVLDPRFLHKALAGVSHPAELTTRVAGQVLDRRSGSLLWTHFGVSGPVALDASRHWVGADRAGQAPELLVNCLPECTEPELDADLQGAARHAPRRPVGAWVGDQLPRRLADALGHHAGVDPSTRLADLGRAPRQALAAAVTGLRLPVTGPRGWDHAEVTAGGVPLAEVDYRTLASRRCPGLYLAGEILDVDGHIGGFNFQWAWATGHLAGRAAAAACIAVP